MCEHKCVMHASRESNIQDLHLMQESVKLCRFLKVFQTITFSLLFTRQKRKSRAELLFFFLYMKKIFANDVRIYNRLKEIR